MLSVQVHLKQVLQGTQLLPLPPARLRCRAGSPLLHEGLHSSMCSSCVVVLQAVCRDGTLTIFASCHTPVTPGCFPTDAAHHASGMSRWQGDSSCWGCGEEQLAAASALLPGGRMLAGEVGGRSREVPPRRSWATTLTFLQAHLPLLVKGDCLHGCPRL